ncbi:MAG: tetratricopeptide repeat protein [Candidatus Eremiobacteraeota bacterium]|nr:tetratricopeptide repeat protein [Candidatus Eremiobacteraeota bacterium]
MECSHCGTKNRGTAKYCLGCGGMLGEAKPATQEVEFSASPKIKKASSPQIIQKGRYLVIQKLGSGGMSRLYLARDTKMDFNVVVKEMSPPQNYPEKTKYFLEKFKNEAKMLYRLRHRGIPRVTDYFAESDKYYMVMEYIEGENFGDILKNRTVQQISIEEMFNWMGRILEILKFLHSQNPLIFHRDVKPANFMLNSNGDVFLVDFGVAKAIMPDEAHTAIGTIGYASPEHYTGKFIKSSDIYSLGASFHYLLTGDNPRYRTPFDFPTLSSYRKDITKDIDEIFNKILDKDSKKRYQSVEELLEIFSKAKRRYFNLKEAKIISIHPSETEIPAGEEEVESTGDVIPPPRETNRLMLPIMKKSRRPSKQAFKRKLKNSGEKLGKKSDMEVTLVVGAETKEKSGIAAINDDDTIVDLKGTIKEEQIPEAPAVEKPDAKKKFDKANQGKYFESIIAVEPIELEKSGIISQKAEEVVEEAAVETPPQKAKEEKQTKGRLSQTRSGKVSSSRPPARGKQKRYPIPNTPQASSAIAKKGGPQKKEIISSKQSKYVAPAPGRIPIKVDKRDLPERPSQKRLTRPVVKKTPEAEKGRTAEEEITPVQIDQSQTPDYQKTRITSSREFDEFSEIGTAGKIWNTIKRNKLLVALIVLSFILLVGGVAYVAVKSEKSKKPKPSPTKVLLDPEFESLLQKARRENALGNAGEAIKLYSRLVKDKSDFAEAYLERGIIYFNKGNYNKAYTDFEKTISLDSKKTKAHFFKGKIALKKGDSKGAYAEFSISINQEKENIDAYYYRGIALLRKGDYSRAISDFESVRHKDASYKGLSKHLAQSYYMRGKEALKKGKYDGAILDFKETLKASSGKKEVINGLIKAYLSRGTKDFKNKDYNSAIDDFNALLALDKSNKDAKKKLLKAHFARGKKRLNSKNPQGAIKDFNIVLKEEPGNIQALFARAGAYAARNETTKIIVDLKKVLSIDPKNKKAKTELIKALYEQGMKYEQEEKYRKAIPAYDNIIKLDPKAVDAYRLRGGAYSRMGQLNRAVGDFKAALKLNPEHVETKQDLSRTLGKRARKLARSGNFRDAVVDVEIALKLSPSDKSIQKEYSRIMTKMGEKMLKNRNPRRSIRAFSKALKYDRENKFAFIYRGGAYLLMNKTELALRDCWKAIELDNDFALAYLIRGDTYFQKKDVKNALNDWEQVIRLLPGSNLAKQARKRLSSLPAHVVPPSR